MQFQFSFILKGLVWNHSRNIREPPSTLRDPHHEKPVINQHPGQQPVAG